MRLPLLVGSMLSGILLPLPLLGQEHKHQHGVPVDKPEAKLSAAQLALADLEQLALQHNPTLAQAALQVEAARGKAQQAGLYPNPTVGYAGELIGTKGTAGDFQGGFVQQTIVTAGKLRLSRAKYSQEAVEAGWMSVAQQLRVLNSVRIGFYELLAAQRRVRIRTDMLKNAEEEALTRREMLNIGLANEAEVLLAGVEVDEAKVALQEQQTRLVALWEKVSALVGMPGMPMSGLTDEMEAVRPSLSWETSLTHLLEDSPELQAARAHIVFDQITLQRERAEPIPNVQVKAGAGRDFESRSTVANVELSVKLPLWNKNQGTIRQVEADLARSHEEVKRVELSLRKRLAEDFQKYQTALVKVNLYRDSAVPKATRAHEVMLDQYKKKRAEWIQVVDYQRKLLKIQNDYTSGLLELRRAEVIINGLLLEGGLSTPPSPRPASHLDATPNPR
jgi:cobalt-zinc-cadmium efflux system outer membrane protein